MTEASTPPLADFGTYRNIVDLIAERGEVAPNHIAFRIKQNGALVDVTTEEFVSTVRAVAKGLIAQGVQAEDRIATQGATSYSWTIADIASLWAGAIVVPIFDTSSPDQVQHILRSSNSVAAFAGTEEQRRGIASQIGEKIWSLDEHGMSALKAAGQHVTDEQLDERRVGVNLDDVATLVFTSGTEGMPKGAIITHRNLIGQVLNIGADYGELVHDRGSTLIFLPLAHVLARGLQLICLTAGMRISYESDPAQAVGALTTLRPTFLVVVPRVLERIRDRIAEQARSKRLGWVWRDAEQTAIAWGRMLEERQHMTANPSRSLKLRHATYDRLFFAKVRDLVGGQIDYLLSGAAPLNSNLNLLFRGMGLEVIEGYGLTESTAPLTGNRPGNNYAGTVGPPTPGHTVRISPEGEVLARGIGISPGYDGIDNSTTMVDGFIRTGDLGTLDSEGRLTITGRLSETIVTSGGKTISPQKWESNVAQDPLVAHAVMVGDSRPYPGALIFLDQEEAAKHGITSTNDGQFLDDTIPASILTAIRRANQLVAAPERVKRIKILLMDMAPGSDFVTPTMKLRRSRVIQKLSASIDELYERGMSV
ncbi:long-chain fatty acid--CoA ligase [Flaviflexus ciconiae]|uniref:Long-chain fatty acid--CoA ligase n=1 Tax=Flaviflexus ciconiae TaxID=2496867 RepID=A0A3S9Q0M6_9ACTO|nr:long-chain fatty acid--CoA ligase [Flaviflexus ciconiae]